MVQSTARGYGRIARLRFVVSLSALLWASLLCFRFQLRGGQSAHHNRLRPLTLAIPAVHGGVPLSDDDNDRGEIKVSNDKFPFMKALGTAENKTDPCGGRYIYVHKLPPRFNSDMLRDCKNLSPWTDMCKFTANSGLGLPIVDSSDSIFSGAAGWYATKQFVGDVIFNARMKQYECLTDDSSVAAAVFVPFYAGCDASRHLWGGENVTVRDATALDLVEWLVKRKEWDIMGGKDHFLVTGRTAWDFRRLTDKDSGWGNKLLLLPAVRNMSTLVVESSPWDLNDFAIPYPTYFHPKKDDDIVAWQDRMRKTERKWLFSFAGGPRPGSPRSIRERIINQCNGSQHCMLMQCGPGLGNFKCHSPSSVIRVFQSSRFSLHQQGDTYTRRSAFDSILAGCIPVFFHPGSAYAQYTWHLPKEYTNYSVFIPEDDIRKKNASIEERLSRIPPKKVEQMREEVIRLIPRIVYADPRAKLESVKDAFDVAVEAVIERVTRLRRNMVVGLNEHDDLMEGNKEWDGYFSEPKD